MSEQDSGNQGARKSHQQWGSIWSRSPINIHTTSPTSSSLVRSCSQDGWRPYFQKGILYGELPPVLVQRWLQASHEDMQHWYRILEVLAGNTTLWKQQVSYCLKWGESVIYDVAEDKKGRRKASYQNKEVLPQSHRVTWVTWPYVSGLQQIVRIDDWSRQRKRISLTSSTGAIP